MKAPIKGQFVRRAHLRNEVLQVVAVGSNIALVNMTGFIHVAARDTFWDNYTPVEKNTP